MVDNHEISHDVDHHEEHTSHAKLYVGMFFLLLFITAVEIAIPIFNSESMHILSLPKTLEVILLLILMVIKGACVMMFYMHLKGDRRMFGTLFVFPMIIVLLMILGFFQLFQPTLW